MNINFNMSNDSNSPSITTNSNCSPSASNMIASRQYLEPTGKDTMKEFLKVNDKKKVQKIPNIKDLGPSKLLNQVKSFLPQLEAAEMSLQARVDAGENVDIENIEEEKPHIEMNFGLNEIHNSDSGSSDSDPDSPPSPAERDNSYTSDSDVDTSSSSSSCSCKSSDCPSSSTKGTRDCHIARHDSSSNAGNMRQSYGDTNSDQPVMDINLKSSQILKRKHPLIQDITDYKLTSKVPNAVINQEENNPQKSQSENI